MAAFRDRGDEPALLYMDGGVDLFTLATNPTGKGETQAPPRPRASSEVRDLQEG